MEYHAIAAKRRKKHSAAKPQPILTTDYTDDTDMGNPCHPSNPWLKFFAACEQLRLLQPVSHLDLCFPRQIPGLCGFASWRFGVNCRF